MENLLEQYLEKYFETKDQNFMDFAEEVISNSIQKEKISVTSYEYIYNLKMYNINTRVSSQEESDLEWKINVRKMQFILSLRTKIEYSVKLPHRYKYKYLIKASRRCINSDFYSQETKRIYYLKNKYNKH